MGDRRKERRSSDEGHRSIIIVIIVGFIERMYLIETTTQGALQYIITQTDLLKQLPTQPPGKHTRSAATGATSLSIQHSLAVHVPVSHF